MHLFTPVSSLAGVSRAAVLTLIGVVLIAASGAGVDEVLAAPSQSAGPPTIPARFERAFNVHYGDYPNALRVAEVTYRFERANGKYLARTDGAAVGIVSLVYSGHLTQSSEGVASADGLSPLRYAEKRGKRAERVLVFDPVAQTMIGMGDPPKVSVPAATQDRLSIFFQLAWLVRRQPAMIEAGRTLRLPLASMKGVDIVTVTSAGRTELGIDGDRVPVIALRLRNLAKPDDPRIDVWLAIDGDGMPVRIRFEEQDGTVVDQVRRTGR